MSDDRRLLVLRSAVIGQGGEWTTRRALRFYRHLGYTPLRRGAARQDLKQLAADGVLILVDTDPGRRYYLPKATA